MMNWQKHALALVFLAALSLGLYGRLYSPLDHAYPSGEGTSPSVTRFIGENPNPWGWNPEQDSGRPAQLTSLPAFHYAAVVLTKLGNEPIYAHRILGVTLALLAPLALYFLLLAFGMPWPFGFATAVGATILSPLAHRGSFLPLRLDYLENTGRAPYVAGLTLALVALALLWRSGHRRRPFPLFIAAVGLALVALTDGRAAFSLAVCIAMMELTILGIAGEYRFAHGRTFLAMAWALVLACFWLSPAAISHFLYWPDEVPWLRIVCGALAIRLLFLGRREPLLCFATLSCWAFVNLGLMLEFEVFLLVALVAGSQRAFEHPQRFYLAFPAFAVLLLFLRFDVDHWPSFNPMTISGLKRQAAEWRGDWGMRPYSQSEDFKLTRWLVENPPRGRVYAGSLSLRNRLNAWVPYAQVGSLMQLRVNGSFSLPSDATLLALGTEYSVDHVSTKRGFPVAFQVPSWVIYRLPFQSLAVTTKGKPLDLAWLTSSHIRITGDFPKDELVNIRVSYHPAWKATQAGQAVKINEAEFGLMTLSPTGSGPIDLEFNGTSEQRFFGYLSLLCWLASISYVAIRSRRG